MKNHLLLTAIVVTLAVVSVNCGPKQSQTSAKQTPQVASEPPAANQTEAVASLPKLWDFWATWCPPCKELKPTVEALEKEYAGQVN